MESMTVTPRASGARPVGRVSFGRPRTRLTRAPSHLVKAACRATVEGLRWAGVRAPGLLIAGGATTAALVGHRAFPAVSPLVVAIVLGVLVADLRPPGPRYAPGLTVASRSLLRIGVALLGLQLAFGDILDLGPVMVLVIVATVASSIAVTLWAGARLGINPAQRLLIACGTSICGAAAVAAADGVLGGDRPAPSPDGAPATPQAPAATSPSSDAAATAIVAVVLFGTLLLGLLPLAVHVLGIPDQAGGIWAGLAIHEVAQAVAAGGLIGSGALAVAVVVKLGRVLMLAPVLAVISVRRRRGAPAASRPPLVPLFVIGFLGCVALASTGAVPAPVAGVAGQLQVALLSAGMFGLGTGVRLRTVRAVGPRPFVLAGIGTAWIGAIGLAAALLLGP